MISSQNLCGGVGGNTGGIGCDPNRGRPVTAAIGGHVFTMADVATPAAFKAAFKAATKLATGNPSKLYGIPENVGVTDKTDANKTGTLGTYGPTVVLVEGKPSYEFQLVTGTVQEKALRQFNNKTVPVFIFDDQKNYWGRQDQNGNFVGYTAILYCTAKPFEDGSTAKVTVFTVSLISASEYGDECKYFPATNMSVSDFAGLQNVGLAYAGGIAQGGNDAKVLAQIGTDQYGTSLNIYTDFNALLSGAGKSLWKATVDATGAIVPITSVVADATAGTAGVAAVSTFTIVKGNTGDTIDIKVNGNSITGGPVAQTSSESTDTLMAVKIKLAINAASNGGFTAANAAGVLSITAPVILGDELNTVAATATATGTITGTSTTAFTGGVTAIGAGSGFIVTLDQATWNALPKGATVSVGLVDPTTLDAANVVGIENVIPITFTKAA